jgi:protein SCO1
MSGSAPSHTSWIARVWPLAAGLVVLLAVGALLLAFSGARGSDAHAFHGTAYPDPEAAPAFALTDHRGETVGLDAFRGQPVLLFFGFTHCPDVCPLTLTRLNTVLDGMGRRGDEVRVLLVTVDPERDTPDALARYVEAFGPRVTGLTADPATLAEMRRAYGVYAEAMPDHAGHPTTVHTTAVFGIDRSGRLRVLLSAESPESELQADIRALLRS